MIVDDIFEKMPDQFKIVEMMAKCEDRTPYIIVCFQVAAFPFPFSFIFKQESERMNTLTREMKRSLKELELGLKGELTMTSEMENLSNSLFFDQVLRDNVHPLKILC